MSADDRSIRFHIKVGEAAFAVAGYVPQGKDKSDVLLGNMSQGAMMLPIRLERTDEKMLDPKAEPKPTEGAEEFKKAMEAGEENREKELKGVVARYKGKPVAFRAVRKLLELKLARPEPDVEGARPYLEEYTQESARYGREMEIRSLLNAAGVLLGREVTAKEALPYANRAAQMLRKDDPPARQSQVLSVQVASLRKAGKTDELKKPAEQLAKLEEELDRDFEKNAIPFKVESFKGRKAASDRVAVVELFTGAQCPPCVAADIAFDAALKTYAPKEAVFLEYHLHVPGPDPLTNTDSEARQKYYEDKVEGTPTAFVDGTVTEPLGGLKRHGEERYRTLCGVLNDELEKNSGAAVKLTVTRKGDTIDLSAEVSGVKMPGEKVRLRLALVEEEARFAGGNGQRLHRHVVRAFLGGPEGFKLEKADSTHKASMQIGELRKSLDAYLTGFAGKRQLWGEARPLGLKKLLVVGFVQEDETRKILQAAQVDVPE